MKKPSIRSEIKFKEMNVLEKILASIIIGATVFIAIAALAAPAIIFIIPFQILVGVITWRISGGFTFIIYKFHMFFNKKDKDSYFLWDIKEKPEENMFRKSLTAALLPTTILLFLIANVARLMTIAPDESGRISILSNPLISLLFIFPAMFTYFVVPIAVFLGSDLKKFDKSSLEVFSVGKITRIRINSVGGLLAILMASVILYFEYQGQIGSFIAETLLILMYSYFTIFWTSYIYFKKYYPRHLSKLKDYIEKDGIVHNEVGFKLKGPQGDIDQGEC